MRVLILLCCAALGAAACASESPVVQASPTGAPPPLEPLTPGQPLPHAELAALDGGASLSTADLERPAVINFWASWCAYCVEEMPAFERVHRQVGDQVRFVGVDREDDVDKARTLAVETGVSYDLVVDPDGSFFRAVQGRGMPTTVLVDDTGTIVHRHAGPLEADELFDLLDQHLGVRRD